MNWKIRRKALSLLCILLVLYTIYSIFRRLSKTTSTKLSLNVQNNNFYNSQLLIWQNKINLKSFNKHVYQQKEFDNNFNKQAILQRQSFKTSTHTQTLNRLSNINTKTNNLHDLKPNSTCPSLQLHKRYKITNEEIACKKRKPSLTGCQYAEETYAYNHNKYSCHDYAIHICSPSKQQLQCSYRSCWETEDIDDINIYMFNISSGFVEKFDSCRITEELTIKTNKYAQMTIQNGYYFLFLSCGEAPERTQLLTLPRNLYEKKEKRNKNKEEVVNDGININVVILDSVSRSHFYRSLMKTIATFNSINTQTNSEAEVLDFEFFQSLHGHSPENNHALNTGTMFPSNMTDKQRENAGTGIDVLLQSFKERNYDVLYQDDMCWEARWGLWLELQPGIEWEDFEKKIKSTGVKDTGLTFASCKILDRHQTDNVFNSDPNQLFCYNGHQQDTYYLQYIQNVFINQPPHKNLFSFANLMVGHDYSGTRIQSIDNDLAFFVKFVSKLKNTVTIILADHGNTYTDFVYQDIEGRFEMYHPSLFMIMTNSAKKILGDEVMTSLRTNQKRLVTMLDLHQTLLSMADIKSKTDKNMKGMLLPIAVNRTCEDLPLRLPNLCVCDGWNAPLENDTKMIGHLEYGVGMLNNRIVREGHGKCKRLVPTSFDNVLQRKENEKTITTFDIHSEIGLNSPNKKEMFSVEIASVISGSVPTLEMEMMSTERISKFGGYKTCMGKDMKGFRLCVCDIMEKPSDVAIDFKNRGNEIQDHASKSGQEIFNLPIANTFRNKRKENPKPVIGEFRGLANSPRIFYLMPDNHKRIKQILKSRTSNEYRIFDNDDTLITEVIFKQHDVENLYMLKRTYYERKFNEDEVEIQPFVIAISYEAINLSTTRSYRVNVEFIVLENLKAVMNKCEITINSNEFLYLCTLQRILHAWPTQNEEVVTATEMN